uniref:glucuronosyltransferase n=1 Tax=Romanomermis culicivorax TaxID=13658 RepID=A0A915KTZ0_ROMCU
MNLTKLSQFVDMARDGCEIMIQDRAFLQKLRDRRFDVAIAHMASLCPMGVINLLKIPTYVWCSSGLLIDYLAANIGGTSPPSFVPQLMSSYTDRMTFWQRCRNFGGALLLAYFYHFRMVRPYNDIFRKHYGPDFPDLYRLAAKSSLLLVNNEELLDFPRPILHKILYIGGIGLSKPAKLDEQWLKVVEDETYRGVVVFSLGSIANTTLMPYAWKKIFIETFDKFHDYKFIWKFDGDLSMFKIPPNVIVSKWLPQVDLFAWQLSKQGFLGGAVAVPLLANVRVNAITPPMMYMIKML